MRRSDDCKKQGAKEGDEGGRRTMMKKKAADGKRQKTIKKTESVSTAASPPGSSWTGVILVLCKQRALHGREQRQGVVVAGESWVELG